MPLLSGAQKWNKQREIDSNIVKLQTIGVFFANAGDENDTHIKLVWTQKMIIMIAKSQWDER